VSATTSIPARRPFHLADTFQEAPARPPFLLFVLELKNRKILPRPVCLVFSSRSPPQFLNRSGTYGGVFLPIGTRESDAAVAARRKGWLSLPFLRIGLDIPASQQFSTLPRRSEHFSQLPESMTCRNWVSNGWGQPASASIGVTGQERCR